MPVLTIYDRTKKKVGDINLDDRVFSVPVRKHLLYDAVKAHGINQRQGTASTRSRGEVRGGGIKPFRQKGTGQARQGSSRSALQVGGGVAFGPKPRSYHYKISTKVGRGALRSALSQLCKENKITVLKDLNLDEIKTKSVVAILNKFSLQKGLIIDLGNKNFERSAANIRAFKFTEPQWVNVYDVLKFQNLLVTEKAILNLEKRLQP